MADEKAPLTERQEGERIGWSAACSMVRAALYDSERRCLNEANTRYAEMNVAETVAHRKQAKKSGRAWQRVAEAHQSVSVALTEVLMRHEGVHEHLRDTARAVPYPRMADDQLVAARLADELARVTRERDSALHALERATAAPQVLP